MAMESRNRAFQSLKPPSVKLSEAALKFMGKTGNIKDVIDSLEQLRKTLQAVASQKDALNDKLAEYVFFPLSAVLKQLEKLTVRARELTLECLLILLTTAWKSHIEPELGFQLLILFTFIADQKGSQTSEELQALTFKCLAATLSTLGKDDFGRRALTETSAVPHLGKAVSVILDRALDGPSEAVKLSALTALQAFCTSVSDYEALAISFLPGIISCLTKILTPKAAKASSKVLASSLEVLVELLLRVFSDSVTQKLPNSADAANTSEQKKRVDKTWLKATVPQIKMALANILKLQEHDRQNVRLALAKLCTSVLQQCKETLSDCTSMLLEAAVTLAGQDGSTEYELNSLLDIEQIFSETLRSSLHYWIISLPRIMESTDDAKKQRRVHQISLTFKLLSERGVDMSIIENDLAANLRDTVVNTIKDPKLTPNVVEYDNSSPLALELATIDHAGLTAFDQVIAVRKSQSDNLKEVALFIKQLSSHENALNIVQELVKSLYGSSGDIQLANFWLSLNILRHSFDGTLSVDDLLDFGSGSYNTKETLLEQLYDFSISILTETSVLSNHDWRTQALALETLAFQATQQKLDFRTELIEALYPVLHFMGSPNPDLRIHAIKCLNILAQECGYKDSGELVVANVDYLVNAVGLRLNTFDISPQAPQVLLMMVRLSGPSLLPYLDDLVDSMFVALESFHGYPRLVDLLFSVLKVIIEEGAKAPQLAITAADHQDPHKKPTIYLKSIIDLAGDIKAIAKRYEADKHNEIDLKPFPQQSWKGKIDGSGGDKNDQQMDDDAEPRGDGDDQSKEPPPPTPRTYSLLLKISNLTQHYLASSSPELRTSLLSLLDTAFPALARHENSFLPLINTLWPVLLPRLDDSEAYVVQGTLDVIGAMCVQAGNFMSARIDELWPHIKRIYRLRTGKAGGRVASNTLIGSSRMAISMMVTPRNQALSPNSNHHYVDAPSRIIWESLVRLLTKVAFYVAVNDDLFDDIVDMLAPVVASQPDVREALEGRNPDAVWLALWRRETQEAHDTTSYLSAVTQLPPSVAKPEWQFAEMV